MNCRFIRYIVEDEAHMIEFCTEYGGERLELRCDLDRLGCEEYGYLRLIEIVLYSEKVLIRRNKRTRERL